MNNLELIEKAKKLLNPITLSESATAGQVACVLVTDNGNTYGGVCVDAACGLGFCAETSAVGSMIAAGESVIAKLCAVKGEEVLSPCGKCRELMIQINPKNGEAEILLSPDRIVTLKELLPEHWLA